MPYIDINNYKIHYNIKGEGYPLILLHDGFYGTETWDSVRDELAKKFMVIDYDRYGYGKSTHIENFDKEMIEFGVKELEEFVNKLGLKDFYLCGHCLGGAIAIHYYLSNSEKVKKLILESVGLYSDDLIQDKCDWVFKPFEDLNLDFKEILIKMHGGAIYSKLLWNIIREDKKSYIMNREYDIREKVKKIKIPVFFIYGDSDFYFDIDHATYGFKLLRNSKLWISPSTNHIVHIEKSKQFLENVIEFLERQL